MANFKDFLIDENAYKDVDEAPKKRKKTEIQFETVFVSGPDWALRRKTARTSQLMCFMTSANQFYIKNEKTGDIEKITEANLSSFLRGANLVHIIDEDGNMPFWIERITVNKRLKSELYLIATNEKRRELCCTGYVYLGSVAAAHKISEIESVLGPSLLKHIFNSLSENGKRAFRYAITYRDYYYQQDEICADSPDPQDLEVQKIKSFISDISNDRRRVRESLKYLNKDNVRYLIERYLDSPAIAFPNIAQVVFKNWFRPGVEYAKPRLNVRKVIDHIFDSGIEQGYANDLDNFVNCWADYLSQQEDIYGKLVEKYPQNLASSEKRLSYTYEQRRAQIDELKFAKAVEAAKPYRTENQDFILTSPESRVDLIDEGRRMSNCIGGYVNRILNGSCMIFFLRKKSDPQTPYVDVEVHANGSLGQVRAKYNKQPTPEARDFVYDWHRKMFEEQERLRA